MSIKVGDVIFHTSLGSGIVVGLNSVDGVNALFPLDKGRELRNLLDVEIHPSIYKEVDRLQVRDGPVGWWCASGNVILADYGTAKDFILRLPAEYKKLCNMKVDVNLEVFEEVEGL